ncbi:PQQ-dependent sugar dehydrogenase [Actinomadura alba]|uniref:PQQ-dependent sugar dehydrogenase n=1 Tax=Actinomadura alba TaxID=406431 RepID=A0ABR7LUK7_9ACTN|nr:PQQ-dependent sugar dehydrogenase [Actinomadura alba]MBC6468145.1 PQQ-dependent sugar dehydrogenase [Actinomadura alba]
MIKLRWCLLTIAALLAALLAVPPTPAQADDQPITDPIPERPITSGLGLVVEEYASFPKSEPIPPPVDPRLMRQARINFIGEVPDGSGRMYVPDLNGKMYLVEHGQPHVYLDVGATFAPQFFSGRGLGQGFGIVAFAPDFKRSGRFYTVHTELASSTTETPDLTPQPNTVYHGVVTEWTADDPSAGTFQGTRREILRLGFGGQVHGIQEIGFNPNAEPGDQEYGLLYIAAGDGGRGAAAGNDDPLDLAIPQGKILRIDPRGTNSANGKYGIPATNPLVGKPGAIGEIYAYGMRDPHRFSWDTGGEHRMFLGHIGEHAIEAVYDLRAGDNLGWPEREGAFVFDKTDRCYLHSLPADDAKYGYDYPVAAYDHDPPPDWSCSGDVGRAISGGYVYRGRELPELYGKYIFGDLVNGRVFYTNEREMRRGRERAPIHQLMLFDKTGERVTMRDLAGDQRIDLRFGRDRAGELYLISKANGKIWKVTGTRRFAGCDVGRTRVSNTAGERNWAPVTPSKWRFSGDQVIMTEPGAARPGPRRPFEYAVLTAGPEFGSARIDAKVRIDTPVEITNRDVIIVFGYRSDTQFYYAHLSTDNTIYPHNGIFVVDNADRVRIEDQWDAVQSRGAVPAITDTEWHDVRVVHCADTGEIAVYVDDSKTPLMTAVDTTFTSGRVGFGSFDNIGRLRDLEVRGTRVDD